MWSLSPLFLLHMLSMKGTICVTASRVGRDWFPGLLHARVETEELRGFLACFTQGWQLRNSEVSWPASR